MEKKEFNEFCEKYGVDGVDRKSLHLAIFGEPERNYVKKEEVMSLEDFIGIVNENNRPRQFHGDRKFADLSKFDYKNASEKEISDFINDKVRKDIELLGKVAYGTPYTCFMQSARSNFFQIADLAFANWEDVEGSCYGKQNRCSFIPEGIKDDYIQMVNDLVEIYEKYQHLNLAYYSKSCSK